LGEGPGEGAGTGNSLNPSQSAPGDEPPEHSQHPNRFRQIVLSYLGQVKWSAGLALLSMLGLTVMELLSPWPLKVIVDNILLGHPFPPALAFLGSLLHGNKMAVLVALAGSIALIAILEGGFSYLQTYLTARIGYGLVYRLRCELFTHIQQLPLAFHHQARRGEVLTKVSGDTTVLRDVFAESTLDIVTHVLAVTGMFVIMFVLNWQLSLIVAATFPLLLTVFVHFQRRIKASARRQRKQEGKVVSQLSEVLTAIPVVQAFGREGYEAQRFETESARNLSEGIHFARTDAAASRSVDIISAVGHAIVIFFGAWQALQGRLSPGDVLIFATYVGKMYKPIKKLVRLSTKLVKAAVSAQRIAEILNIAPDIQDAPNAIVACNLRWEITFKAVSFRYAGDQNALDDVSFTITAGQRVALVGASGAGKSTIVNLILRLYDPRAGAILVDGVDLRAYQRVSLRRQIGLVLQDSILFGATVAENIAYGKPEATPAEIEAAARQAHAHDFIMALPDGYDTVIGEMGSTLSGGQRQRIAIARALVKQPSVLILDEPTSALDAESEMLVKDTINRLGQGKTTLVIAHNLATIRDFDQILVLRDGRLVEQGTHAELMGRQGYYHELFRLQDQEFARNGRPQVVSPQK
jgi:ATP-binding cassette subfamily B protein/subfamily B ATP-binding cassette protein MsbA